MRRLVAEAMPDLNPVAERIVSVNRVAALLVPRNLRRVRSPVVFLAIEFFQDRRIERGIDAKIDMRPFDRSRATLGHLVDPMQNDQLSGVWHRQRNLLLARNLFFLGETKGVAIPVSSLL